MTCDGCGNQQAHAWRKKFSKETGWSESCDACSGGFAGVPDVYFKGSYVDENLSSEEYPGAKLITSRRDKQEWLKRCNLREAGDRHHGATSFDPISHRHAMESLSKGRQ